MESGEWSVVQDLLTTHQLKLNFGNLFHCRGLGGIEIEEFSRVKAEWTGDEIRGKLHQGLVVLRDDVVVVLACEADAVFGRGQFFLKREEVLVRLQIGICLRDR